MSHSVRYTRPVPPEWPGLAAYADKVIGTPADPRSDVSLVRRFRLDWRLRRYSHEQIETNHYYGLGLIMCGVKAYLQKDRIRQQVVREAAEGLLLTALQRRGQEIPSGKPFMPVVDDLLPAAMEKPFFAMAAASQDAMPVSRQVLLNGLARDAMLRRQATYEEFGVLKRQLAHLAVMKDMCASSKLAARHTALNALTGATSVYCALLTGCNPKEQIPEEILATPVADFPAERANQPKVYIDSAKLRLDEFMAGAAWEGSGQDLRFNTDIFSTQPEPFEPSPRALHLHEARLICPAVQAGGLAHDVAVQILPAIISTAQQLVPGEHFKY